MKSLRQDILDRGSLQFKPTVFAGGQAADLKLDLEIPLLETSFRERVAAEMSGQLLQAEVDVILPVPFGADTLGVRLASQLGLPVFLSDKQEGKIVVHQSVRRLVSRLQPRSVGIIEDVANRYTSSGKIVDAIESDKFVIMSIWRRGQMQDERDFKVSGKQVDKLSLITEPVPGHLAELATDSDLHSYVA